jgi:uncharacterized membrane protein YeaQ/YmgE (transglycosylase-associated protein family)
VGPLSWILLGLVSGWLAGLLTGRRNGRGCITTSVIGILGAFVGGAIANLAGYDGRITDFSVRSVLIAALGAALLLVVFGTVSKGR